MIQNNFKLIQNNFELVNNNLDRSKIIFHLQKDQVSDLLKDWALTVVEGGPKIKEVFNLIVFREM